MIGSTVAGSLIGSTGIYLNSYVNNSTFIQNEIFGISTTNASVFGIYLGTGITNTKISKNKIHDIVVWVMELYTEYMLILELLQTLSSIIIFIMA